jgi:hypothetical protein
MMDLIENIALMERNEDELPTAAKWAADVSYHINAYFSCADS